MLININYDFDTDIIQINGHSFDLRDPESFKRICGAFGELARQASISAEPQEDLVVMAEMFDIALGGMRAVTRATQILNEVPSASHVKTSQRKQAWISLTSFWSLVRRSLHF